MCPPLSRQIFECNYKCCPNSYSFGFCSRDVIGTVSITSPINRSHLSPLLPAEMVDKLELDCLNYVRVSEKIPNTLCVSLFLVPPSGRKRLHLGHVLFSPEADWSLRPERPIRVSHFRVKSVFLSTMS